MHSKNLGGQSLAAKHDPYNEQVGRASKPLNFPAEYDHFFCEELSEKCELECKPNPASQCIEGNSGIAYTETHKSKYRRLPILL